MQKIRNTLDANLKYVLNFVRVPAFTTSAVTRGSFAHFCRYSCISDVVIK